MTQTKSSEMSVLAELESKFRCQRCGWCCRNLLIRASGAELDQLAKALRKRPRLLRKLERFERESPTGMFAVRGCPFYNDNAKSCTIYELRPQGCRDFPFKVEFTPDGHERIIIHENCPGGMEVLDQRLSGLRESDAEAATLQTN